MSKKVWNLMYVVGNPAMFSRVTANADNPLSRADAMAVAEKVAGNGWRVWVEHHASQERIFESQAEKDHKAALESKCLIDRDGMAEQTNAFLVLWMIDRSHDPENGSRTNMLPVGTAVDGAEMSYALAFDSRKIYPSGEAAAQDLLRIFSQYGGSEHAVVVKDSPELADQKARDHFLPHWAWEEKYAAPEGEPPSPPRP